ncbi:uncharacterized protein F5Z01DRAFT_752326 [Emericellopsis atlantica]|uniref:Uncharacterized protein n=1 Tax=Emericellopsis atlantica TaxID=2614577 RepID=A0A9P7ZIJ2_9HYPO|nr:uncharacterized protein F5Z01DRAFT_752326 [Emericellopsis atlantica]KAG9252123.1 hypothetical protein F5Z01DRAFT_752326 [Emericellopsis atlantica]
MSLTATASLRPLGSQCLQASRLGVISLTLQWRASSLNVRAIVSLPQQRRLYSDQHDGNNHHEGRRQPPMPKLTFRQFLGRVLTVSFRNAAHVSNKQKIRTFFRGNPVAFAALIVLTVVTFALVTSQLYLFYKTFFNPQISRYPEPVATSLRRAIYYTTITPDPERALKFYRRAMAQTRQLNMDIWSDEVLGIRIMVAFWLEKQGNFGQSIEVLENIRKECLEWIGEMEKNSDKIDDKGYLKDAPKPSLLPEGTDTSKMYLAQNDDTPETMWRRRERLLQKAISTSVKLGELYASQHVLDPDASHEHLVYAVESTLKEFRRRRESGKPRPGETSWMTPTEVGAMMESLGRNYEKKGEFHLAIPLFFQGLRNCESPCHRAVIMNNLAACFAQHPLYSPTESSLSETESLKTIFDSSMPNTRKDCLEAAANWAQNAYVHAKDVKGDDKTDECDEACAVALCNWGDVAAMQGKKELAKKKYTQSIDLCKKLDFKAGSRQAQEGLRRLNASK